MKTVVKMKFGSHLYGTNTPESDFDFKAVHLPDARDIVLQRVPDSIQVKRSKADGEKNLPGELDQDSYSLQRFLELLADGQTVAIDMLFAPTDALLEVSPIWNTIVLHRHLFLTKKSAAFLGYCRQQANKYGIKGSRVSAAKAAMEFFAELLDIGIPTSKVGEFSVSLNTLVSMNPDHMRIVVQETTLGHSETYFECCNRKVGFNNTVKEALGIFARIYENYGDRARLAQDNEGVDWKALSHAVRVGYEAIELLKTGHVTFPLPKAAHILDIKKGRIDYATVAAEIEQLLLEVEAAAVVSTMRDQADTDFIDDLVASVYADIVKMESCSK